MPNMQLNLRIPEEHRGLAHDIARRLREQPDVAERLRAVLDDGAPAGVQDELADLRRRVEALEATQRPHAPAQRLEAPEAPAPVQTDLETHTAAHSGGEAAPSKERFKTDSGYLTPDGKAYVADLIRGGASDGWIAGEVGVKRGAIYYRRKKMKEAGEI
jgi:hypothetical protein